jgi:iron complex outermembrane receptor protein
MNRIFLLMAPLLLHLSVLAQQGGREVSGRVTDNGGQPLAGATVSNRNSGATAVSASNGTYRIRANTGDVLVFTSVSFAPVERKVGEGSVIDVALQSSASQLSDVVVVGYGQSTRRALTSAVTTIRPADMNRGPITDVGQLLQGKVPGLNITANGDPNRRAAIILRGASTINSPGGPFFVIDGVPGADIALVAPDDIASIDVLKDAAATAIYGNRAAAGVIMITTKKGRKGQSQVNYNGYVGIEKVSSRLELMDADQHRAYLKSQGLSYNPLDDLGQNTDWQKAVQRPQAISHNHNLSFSGGSDKATYSASVNYINREGIMTRSNQERFIARLNVEQLAMDDKLKLSLNVTNSRTNSKLVPLQNVVLEQTMSHLPVSPVYNPDGSWFENFNIPGYFNPMGMVDNARDDVQLNNLVASLGAEMKLPFGLTYNLLLSHQNNYSVSSSFYNTYYSRYNPAQFYSNPDPGFGGSSLIATSIVGVNGSAFRSYFTDRTNNLETFLGWNRRIGEHSLNAVVGYSWLSIYSGDGIQSSSTNFITDFISYNNLALGNPYAIPNFRIRLAGGAAEKRLISDFARLNYGYRDKYLMQASVRRDGSSVFGTNYQWGYFPSVGLAWRISNEGFMEGQKLFDDLKLRASYGVTGNSEGIGAFNAKLVYGVSGVYYNNGILENSYGPQQGANPDLRWEKTSTSNIGLDFSILKGRVTGSVELYEKLTSDMLFQYAVSPSIVPGGRIWANGGSMSNRGIEFMVNATPVESKDFTWTTTLNLANNRNEITGLTNPYSRGDSILYVGPRGQGQTGASLQILKVGKPLGQFFSFIYEGKNSAGLSQFRKKDGTITTAPLNGTDYFYIGDAQPRLLAGWNNTLRYKRFDVNFFFRGTFGAKIFNASRANLSYTPNASVNNLHALVTADDKVSDARNSFFSTRYVENGNYVRLDNATLGYDLGSRVKGIRSIRLYLTGNNLLTFTKYSGIDPEINQGGVAPGVDNNNFYPRTRTVMFGATVSF